MSVENDNNNANYEEIEGHVKVLSAKLSQMTQNNSGLSTCIEDLTDYYERAVQLRIMRIQTLEEIIQEKEATIKTNDNNLKTFAVVAITIFAVNLAINHPDEAFAFVSHAWSHILVAALAIVAFAQAK